jgi:branched-chain amino acid transport system substrate-binding protein
MVQRSILAVVAVLALLAGPVQAAPDPYVIPAILTLTGPAANSGQQYAEALRIFEGFANQHGGLRGRPIHFDIHDDGSQPANAVQLLSGMVAAHAPVVIGPSPTQTCNALIPLAATNGPLVYCFTPGSLPPRNGYVFAAAMALSQFDRGMIRYLRLKGYRRLAIISSTDASGQTNDAATREVLALPENRDLSISTYEHINPSDISAAAIAAHIKNSDAQAIVAWIAGPTFGTVLRALRDAGVDLPLTANGANTNPDTMLQFESYLPTNMPLPGFPFMASGTLSKTPLQRPVNDLLTAYRAAGSKLSPGTGYAWDAAAIILAGLRQIGPQATAEQLRDYILGLRRFAGIDGIYDFSSGDQHGLSDANVVMVAWDPKTKDWLPLSRLGSIPLKP